MIIDFTGSQKCCCTYNCILCTRMLVYITKTNFTLQVLMIENCECAMLFCFWSFVNDYLLQRTTTTLNVNFFLCVYVHQLCNLWNNILSSAILLFSFLALNQLMVRSFGFHEIVDWFYENKLSEYISVMVAILIIEV